MKRILCLSLAMIFATSMFAQKGLNKKSELEKSRVTAQMETKAVTGLEKVVVPGENTGSPVQKGDRTNGELLLTIYDLQGNSYPTNRAYRTAEGTMGFTATIAEEDSYTNRGSGYNYFNGVVSGPDSGWMARVEMKNVETERSGWPTLVSYGTGEICLSHTSVATNVYKRDVRGEGEWISMGSLPFDETTDAKYTWPKAGVSVDDNGTEYLHVVASHQWTDDNDVVRTKLRYWRSSDGGNTWDIQEQEIPGFDYESYTRLNSDYVTVITKGNIVVLLLLDSGEDAMYVRSEDNGTTWQHHFIYQHWFSGNEFFEGGIDYLDIPIANDDTIELWCPSSGTGALDNNGLLHVVMVTASISRYKTPGKIEDSYYSYGAGVDGISYWNENMGQIQRDPSFVNNMGNHTATTDSTFHIIAMDRNERIEIIGGMGGSKYGIWSEGAYDENDEPVWPILQNWNNEHLTFYRPYGLSTMPTLTIDNNGSMVIFYATLTKSGDQYAGAHYYRRIFACQYDPITQEWEEESVNITDGFMFQLSEIIYPVTPQGNAEGNKWHVFFSTDLMPGLFLDYAPEKPVQSVPTENIYQYRSVPKHFNYVSIDEVASEKATFSMNPNPASKNVIINLDEPSTVEIYNMTGQLVQVLHQVQGNIDVNVSDYASGVYLVNVRNAAGAMATKKLIVQ